MIIAQSMRSPKRSRQAIRSRVKPLAGPVADAVGVVEQQQVERVGADPLQALLGRHPQVARVLVGPPQPRIGEAWKPFRPFPLTLVEVVPDGADQRVLVPRHPSQRPPQHPIGLALPVGIGGENGFDPASRPQQSLQPLLLDRFAEVKEPPSTPGANRRSPRFTHGLNRSDRRRTQSRKSQPRS
jgi:hypothetical protein